MYNNKKLTTVCKNHKNRTLVYFTENFKEYCIFTLDQVKRINRQAENI